MLTDYVPTCPRAAVGAVPAPLTDRVTALTPRGHAAVAIIRLRGQVIALDSESRAWIVELLRDLADDLDAEGPPCGSS